jgi:tetratricopeptide (TPR) repeat protein
VTEQFRTIIGREAEQARIAEGLQWLGRGSGGVLLFHGPRGIGKTHLQRLAITEGLRRGHRVLWSQGAWGDPSPYHLWRVMLEIREVGTLLPGREDGGTVPDAPEVDGAFVQDSRPVHIFAPGEASGGVFTSLLAGDDAGSTRFSEDRLSLTLVVEQLRRLLTELSAEKPVVIIFEDLQWADRPSLKALASLGSFIEEHRILVLGNFSDPAPEGPSGEGALAGRDLLGSLESERSVRSISVGPLGLEEARIFVAERLGGPAPLEERPGALLLSWGAGNPTLLALLVWDARHHGWIREGEGGWEWQGPPEIEGGCPSLEELWRRRILSLPPEEREILEACAILGSPVDYYQLRALCPAHDLDALLGRIQRSTGFVRPAGRTRYWKLEHGSLPPVLRSLTGEDRYRELHRKAGLWLAEYAPERAEAVAHHLYEAGEADLALPWITEAWDCAQARADAEAMIRLARMGRDLALQSDPSPETRALWMDREALGLHDLGHTSMAMDLWRKGLDGLPGGPVKVRMSGHWAEALSEAGDYEEAERVLKGAETVPLDPGEAELAQGYLAVSRLRLLGAVHNYHAILEEAPERLARVRATAAPRDVGLCLHYLAFAHISLGRFEEAGALLEEGKDLAEKYDIPSLLVQFQLDAAVLAYLQDRFGDALRLLEPAVEVGRRSGNTPQLVRALSIQGEILGFAGRYREARERLREAVQITRAAGSVPTLLNARALWGLFLIRSGEVDSGLALVEELLADPGSARNREIHDLIRGIRAFGLTLQGSGEEAERELAEVPSQYEGQYGFLVEILRGYVWVRTRGPAAGIEKLREVWDLAQRAQRRYYEATALAAMADAHALTGQWEEARRGYETAREIFQRIGATGRAQEMQHRLAHLGTD